MDTLKSDSISLGCWAESSMNHLLYIYLNIMPKEVCFRSFVKVVAHSVIVVSERKRELLLLRAIENCMSC
jgi:hypothetical protein